MIDTYVSFLLLLLLFRTKNTASCLLQTQMLTYKNMTLFCIHVAVIEGYVEFSLLFHIFAGMKHASGRQHKGTSKLIDKYFCSASSIKKNTFLVWCPQIENS